jgi:hypothetical protein
MAADNLITALTAGPQAMRRAAVINPEVLVQ